MKPTRLSVFMMGLLAGAVALAAADRAVSVTPQNVFAWSIDGDTPLNRGGTLILPPGTQLARRFESPQVTVAFSGPVRFGRLPGESPVVEIGDAALVFVEREGSGALVLVPGAGEAIVLPVAVALDEHGAGDPKWIAFTRSGGNATIVVNETRFDLAVAENGAASAEVILTAGDTAWALPSLTVTIQTPEAAVAAPDAAGQGNGQDHARSSTDSSDAERAGAGSAPGIGAVAVSAGSAGKPPVRVEEAATGSSTLEVFTPPAIRRGNAEGARSAAFGRTKPDGISNP
jgi:hypothetical protein